MHLNIVPQKCWCIRRGHSSHGKYCSSVPSHLSKRLVFERTATLPSAVHGSERNYPLPSTWQVETADTHAIVAKSTCTERLSEYRHETAKYRAYWRTSLVTSADFTTSETRKLNTETDASALCSTRKPRLRTVSQQVDRICKCSVSTDRYVSGHARLMQYAYTVAPVNCKQSCGISG